MSCSVNVAEAIVKLVENHPEGITTERIVKELMKYEVPPSVVKKVLADMLRHGKLHKVPDARISKMVFKVKSMA